MTWLSDGGGEFVASARQAMRTGRAADYLQRLGWWDLLDDLDDADARDATFALFEAQGRECADTPALNALLAQPYVAVQGDRADLFSMAIDLGSPTAPGTSVFLGDTVAERLLVDRPGSGVHVASIRDAVFRPLAVHGGSLMRAVEFEPGALSLFLD